jgi:hypothetical protein
MQSVNIDVLGADDVNNKFDEVRIHIKVKLFREFTTLNWLTC